MVTQPTDTDSEIVALVRALARAAARKHFTLERGSRTARKPLTKRAIDPKRDARLSKPRFYIEPDLSAARYVYVHRS